MSDMVIPYVSPSKSNNAKIQGQYPSLWNILDIASSTRFRSQQANTSSTRVIDLITPDNDIRARNLKKNCAYRIIDLYPSTKNGMTIHCESYIERNFAHYLEFHPEVIAYKEQPCIIKWVDQEGIHHSHTPDFRIEFRNGNIMIVEVKADQALNDSDLIIRTEILSREIKIKYGYQYLLIVESQLEGVVLLNADLIRQYPKGNIPSFEYEVARRIFECARTPLCMDDIKSMAVEPVLKRFSQTVKTLIRRGVVTFDMTIPLNDKTLLKWNERSKS